MILAPATGVERDPILSSWLQSYRTADAAGLISEKRWGKVMSTEMNSILARARVVVARGDDPGTFYGWVAFERPGLLHYVYVWLPYRGRGVARALVRGAGLREPFFYSCETERGEEIADAMNPRPIFRPQLARTWQRKRKRKRKPNGKAPIIEYRRSGTGPTADTCTDAA
jgi:GNAT superfamily N-acetyltransferase